MNLVNFQFKILNSKLIEIKYGAIYRYYHNISRITRGFICLHFFFFGKSKSIIMTDSLILGNLINDSLNDQPVIIKNKTLVDNKLKKKTITNQNDLSGI